MSPAFRGRSIGRVDGPDRASNGHFAKKILLFFENQPSLQRPFQYIFQKTPQTISKSTRSLDRMGYWFFANKTFSLSKINPCSKDPLNNFLQKPPHMFLKSTFKPPLIISLFLKK